MYWAKKGENAGIVITPFHRPTIRLPEAEVQGYILAPFMVHNYSHEKLLEQIVDLNADSIIAESMATVHLIGYAANAVRWKLLDYADLQENVGDQELSFNLNMLRLVNNSVGFWMV